jgi:hypothetical protein
VDLPEEDAVSLVTDADVSWIESFKADHGAKHLLAMSRGKDALASWLVMRRCGIEVVPFHLYIVPGLEFVAESLAEIEKVFGVKIIERPHRSLYRMLNDLIYQPPTRVDSVNQLDPKVMSYQDIYADVRVITNSQGTMVGSGVRACDSIVRRISFQKHGHVRPRQETFFPVWNFRKADVMDELRRGGVKLPEEYAWFSKTGDATRGRSFDGIDARFLVPIKKHRPRDYQRILEWFPMAEIEVYRHELS